MAVIFLCTGPLNKNSASVASHSSTVTILLSRLKMLTGIVKANCIKCMQYNFVSRYKIPQSLYERKNNTFLAGE